MKKHTFRTYCETCYYGGYEELKIEVFGICNYFLPSTHDDRLINNGNLGNNEYVFLVIFK